MHISSILHLFSRLFYPLREMPGKGDVLWIIAVEDNSVVFGEGAAEAEGLKVLHRQGVGGVSDHLHTVEADGEKERL